MFKLIVCVALLVPVSGCVSFVPTHSAAIFKDLEETNKELGKLETALQDVYGEDSSFDEVSGIYVAALASARAAKQKAEDRSTFLQEKIAEVPAQKVARAIGNCEASILSVMNEHKKRPISADEIRRQSVIETCQIARTMEGLLK